MWILITSDALFVSMRENALFGAVCMHGTTGGLVVLSHAPRCSLLLWCLGC